MKGKVFGVETDAMVSRSAVFKQANAVLKENVRALMSARRISQTEIALWCGHGKSWFNKWINGNREIQFKDLDRLADFFGLLPHELFCPGISPLTERRSGIQRRSGTDRRAHAVSLDPPSPADRDFTQEMLALAKARLDEIEAQKPAKKR